MNSHQLIIKISKIQEKILEIQTTTLTPRERELLLLPLLKEKKQYHKDLSKLMLKSLQHIS